MTNYYKIFFILLVVSVLSPFYDFFQYVYGITFVKYLFKIPFIAIFILAVFYHLNHRLKLYYESCLFIIFGFISLVYGLISNQGFNVASISHIYSALMPVIMVSFGSSFASNLNIDIEKFAKKAMWVSFYSTIIALLMYVYYHQITKEYSYSGFGTDIPFIVAFLLVQKEYIKYIVSVILSILSYKRSIILTVIAVAILYFSKKYFSAKLASKIKIFVFIAPIVAILLFLSFNYANQHDYFKRFELVLVFDINDEDALFRSSSGRFTEILSVTSHLSKRPSEWVYGAGMGSKYNFLDPRKNYVEEQSHYVHISPFFYIFVYGLPFTILLYIGFFTSLYKARLFIDNFYYLGFIALFFGSFLGSKLFIDPRIWFLFGVVKFMGLQKNIFINNLSLWDKGRITRI